MAIQWFPGHMNSARNKAAETMEFTDVIIEVLDARAPEASSIRQTLAAPAPSSAFNMIDLHITVGVVPFRELHDTAPSEPSARIRERVVEARCRQAARTGRTGAPPVWNSSLGQREIQRWCRPTPDGARLLEDASDRMSLSSRGVHRVLKVGRTIADLEGREGVEEHHLAEALQYRPKQL